MRKFLFKENIKSVLKESDIWLMTILSVICLSFILSDWTLFIFSFGDYLLLLASIMLIAIRKFKVNSSQLKVAMFIISIIIANSTIQMVYSPDFNIKLAVASLVKVILYMFIILAVYNLILEKQKKKGFLLLLNWAAIITFIIGVYITIAIYSQGNLPYRFFWNFTRYDIYSYYFESNPNIIRTRSLFSEPAHFGYFLNLILAINYFSQEKFKAIWIFNIVITVGILLTFSYSMIAILLVLNVFKLFELIKNKELKWNRYYWIVICVLLIFVLIFWSYIEVTIVSRTLSLISGNDTSAQMRLVDSWQYINSGNIFIGNGIGHTPVITNTFAYLQSDLGIPGTVVLLSISLFFVKKNVSLGILFILLNFSRGGYLGPAYWLVILSLLVFTKDENSERS